MSEIKREFKAFIGYEYKTLVIDSDKISAYMDAYENFGWELDERSSLIKQQGKSTLQLKRDCKILNRAELTRLQRKYEDCINQIDALERSKSNRATVVSVLTGIVGTACMAGSVFAVTNTPPLIVAMILLAIPGFAGWILSYFVYRKLVAEKTKQINPLIEEKKEELYKTCEKGYKLLV